MGQLFKYNSRTKHGGYVETELVGSETLQHKEVCALQRATWEQ
jgi:hypothetical protein